MTSADLRLLAGKCEEAYSRAAAALGADLAGGNVLDLCADQMPGATLEELRVAIAYSQIRLNCSPRVRAQISRLEAWA